jgi:hypothetical protein
MDANAEREQLDQVTRRLSARFQHLPADLVAQAVAESAAQLVTATIRDYVPLLVEKQAREWLQAQDRARVVPAST